MYQLNSARTLKIGIINHDFSEYINDTILNNIKICQSFELQTEYINGNYHLYNFLFYVIPINDINNHLDAIQTISTTISNPKTHLFIIVTNCDQMVIDDDGDLVLSDKKLNQSFQKFDSKISTILPDELFHICKLSIDHSLIWKTISDDSSIVNLTDDQIDKLVDILHLTNSLKLPMVDKKRNVRTEIKKIDVDNKLAETGLADFHDSVVQYFKIIYQKKVVCQNYISAFNDIKIGVTNLDDLVKEVHEINYLKEEMHAMLIGKLNDILLGKLNDYIQKSTIKINEIAPYQNLLGHIHGIATKYQLNDVGSITNTELCRVNNLVASHHQKEIEKVTDLDKIYKFMANNISNAHILFNKLKDQPKIISDNIDKMDQWVEFVDRCLSIGIGKEPIIELITEVIMAKIINYSESRINNGTGAIYPHCLHVFLVQHLQYFAFTKLYMFMTANIRYAGRNVSDLIRGINVDGYNALLVLEQKLLELHK